MYGFIYITTNLITNKKYIGMKKYTKGWQEYLGSSKPLQQDIQKYGIKNFKRQIIEECVDKKQLQEREIFYLKQLNVIEDINFYNLSIPHPDFRIKGNKPDIRKGKTWEEIFGVEGAKQRREKSKLKGKTWEEIYSPEIAEQKRRKNKEKRSFETRKRMSESRKGIKLSKETKQKLREANLGKKLSEETKSKMSLTRRKLSAEKKKMINK